MGRTSTSSTAPPQMDIVSARRRFADRTACVEEVLLPGRALTQLSAPPFLEKSYGFTIHPVPSFEEYTQMARVRQTRLTSGNTGQSHTELIL